MKMNFNFLEQLKQINGIDVSKFDDSFLKRSFEKRITESNCGSDIEYCTLLERDPGELRTFIDALQISYSAFFRKTLTCAVLEQIILPSLALEIKPDKCKEIRIWSAACAGGEEAYTLAILLEELIASYENLTYRIFATDQSGIQINKALKGQYSAAALNNLSVKRADMWFNRQEDTYTVRPELKKHIDFSTFDLLDEALCCPPTSIFGDFDLVICANLFFYYKEDVQKIILAKASHCLADGGYLISGETERDILMKSDYREIYSQAAIFRPNHITGLTHKNTKRTQE